MEFKLKVESCLKRVSRDILFGFDIVWLHPITAATY